MPPIVLQILVDATKGIAELQSFDKAVQGATKSTQQSGQSAQQASQGTQSFGASLGASSKNALAFAGALTGIQLGLSAIGNVIQGAVTQVVSFEAAMANVNTLGVRSAEVQQQLRTQILQLPPALGSATELAQGLYEVLSSGVEPANAVAFLGEAAALAKAGLAQLDTSVVALTKTMAAYNIPTTQAGEVSDLLFKTVEIGQGSLQQFAGAMPQVVQIAASMGLSLKDASNAMATLSQTFKSADTAATGLRSLLSQVIQNNDKFLALGINIKQVIGQEGLLGLVRVLQQVSQGDTGKLKEYVGDIEGLQAAIALTGPQFQTLIKNQKAFEDSAGAVDRAVKMQTATVKGSFMELVNALGGLANDIAPPFLTAFARVAQGATTVVTDTRQAFKDFPKIVQEALDNIQKEADTFRAATKDKPLISFTEDDVGIATLKEFFRMLALGLDSLSMSEGAFRKARDAAVAAAEGTGQWRDETERGTAALAAQNAGLAQNSAERKRAAVETKGWRDESARAKDVLTLSTQALTEGNTALQGFNKGLEELRAGGARSAHDLATRFDALKTNLEAMASSGTIGAGQIRAAYEQMATQLRDQFGELPPVLQQAYDTFVAGARNSASGMREAYKQFGIDTRENLQKLAKDALASFQAIEKDAKASPDALLDAWLDVVDKVNKGAFQKLPEGLLESSQRMQEIARKLGVELPKLITDKFGDITVKTKEVTDKFGASFEAVFQKVTEAEIKFGNNLRDHLSPALVKTAEDMGLLGERTEELEKNTKGLSATAIMLGHEINKLGEEVNAYGNAVAKTTKETQALLDLQIKVKTPFAEDLAGLQQQLQQANADLLALGRRIPQLGYEGYKQQQKVLMELIATLEQKIAALKKTASSATGGGTTGGGTTVGTSSNTGGSQGSQGGGTTGGGGSLFISQRQHGGPVWAGQPYLVGERGPEVVVPRQSGTVLPAGQRQGSVTYNLVIHTQAQDAATLARDLVPYLRQADLSQRRMGG